jgi:oxygen-independent coproporphyrinogen-3 oxidase
MSFSPNFQASLRAAQAALADYDHEALIQAGLQRDPLDYYLLATYPPLKAMAPIDADEVFCDLGETRRAYIHIPFCEQYCTFCHYAKEINPRESRVERYLRALHREIELTTARLENHVAVQSVYFGGGTPSYLDVSQLHALLEHLQAHLDIEGDLIFELHPGVVRQPGYEDRVRLLAAAGVNRWVFGIQSMDEQVLAKLNRGHGRAEVYDLLEKLRRNGCDDISVDLIFGCPYQTLENWHETLRLLIEAGVDKFNVFPLMFKPTDPIALHYQREPEIFPTGEQRLLMHFMAETILAEHGYRKGPILFYSRGKHAYPGLDCLEACKSPEAVELVPFGVSSFGYLGHTQYYNHCSMTDYLEAVEQGRIPVWRGITLSPEERMRRVVMLGLRSRGACISDFVRRFGHGPQHWFSNVIERLERAGLIATQGDLLQLTARGAVDAAGVAALFCSEDVHQRVRTTNDQLADRKRSLLERHDFSPIDHIGVRGVRSPRLATDNSAKT